MRIPPHRNSLVAAIRGDEPAFAGGVRDAGRSVLEPVSQYIRLRWRAPQDDVPDVTRRLSEGLREGLLRWSVGSSAISYPTSEHARTDSSATAARRSRVSSAATAQFPSTMRWTIRAEARAAPSGRRDARRELRRILSSRWMSGLFATATTGAPRLESIAARPRTIRAFEAYDSRGLRR